MSQINEGPIFGCNFPAYFNPVYLQCAYAVRHDGLKIVGNGTIQHPLDIEVPPGVEIVKKGNPINSMRVMVFGEKGGFSHLNGLTFPVKYVNNKPELNTLFVAILVADQLSYEGMTTIDVPLKNVLIVDADKVCQALYDAQNWNSSSYAQQWAGFNTWARLHNFSFKAEYNCPA